MKTLLASVSDKSGLVELIQHIRPYVELTIYATGSTAAHLIEAGIPCQTVETLTGFPEILDGRVKTLHPKVFAGLLAKSSDSHQETLKDHGIPAIDFVVVNLYPFEETVQRPNISMEDALETIDIGGVALIRAAAKNWSRIAVLSSPNQYPKFLDNLKQTQGEGSEAFRRLLAYEAFQHTARYDTAIAQWFTGSDDSEKTSLPMHQPFELTKIMDLRYGENPGQPAAWYRPALWGTHVPFEQLQGKELSANNIVDAYAAFAVCQSFAHQPSCAIIKHNNPCGVAVGQSLYHAYLKAYEADPVSAFGGVFGFTQTVDIQIAERLTDHFFEIVVAPSYTPEALAHFESKKNVRVLRLADEVTIHRSPWMIKDLNEFGLLWQANPFNYDPPTLETVTEKPLPVDRKADVLFAWAVVKHLTSNAIAVAKEEQTLGLGIGQTSRIASTERALIQAGDKAKGAVLASDGFFPAVDNIEAAAEAGIEIIVQPGGSIKDVEVIAKANELGLVMCFTGQRCFKH